MAMWLIFASSFASALNWNFAPPTYCVGGDIDEIVPTVSGSKFQHRAQFWSQINFFGNSKIFNVLEIKSETHFTIYRGEFNFEFEFRERLSDKMYEEIPYFQAHTVSKSPFSRKQA